MNKQSISCRKKLILEDDFPGRKHILIEENFLSTDLAAIHFKLSFWKQIGYRKFWQGFQNHFIHTMLL